MPPLTEITESYTFIADDFNSAGTLPISEGTMLDNGKVYSPAGNNAATNKKSSEINGASHLNSMRLKGAQNSLVFKTAVDVAVTVYGNAHDSRVYAAGTTNGGVELGKGQTGSGVFTFNASAGTTVYLTAVNDADNSGGDLFIAGFTVEPTANAAAEDGAVQYLIPEGDVVTVDATPDTAGLYPIVTVKGADGQDIAVSDNKFTMPGQNVTTEVTFGDAPATATPAPTATVSPEPTATATVAPPTATPVFPSYANWNIGQAKIDTTDGAAAEVVYPAEGGKAAIEVTSRNIYTTLDQEVSAGQANVSLDVYIDPAVPKNFRIYLESGTENYQNPNGEYVFAEVANNNNSSVNYGPNPAEENKLFDYSQMTAGWYKFNITLDYEGTDFITLEVTAPDGTVAGTAKMGAIAGKSTALRQVRLIQTAAAAQFADMAITVSGQPTATPAPSTPSPTAVPVSSIVVPANDLTLDGGAVLSDNAGQNYTWTEKATDEMKSTFGDPIDSVNTAKFALMNGDGRNVSKTINIPADGEYKLMVMSIEYNNRYFTASVDNGAAIEPESQTPGKMATNNAGGSNVDLTVTEYNLGTLTNGEHTVKVISAANNSRNILAIAVVPVAAPATPDPSATPEPNKYIATVNVTGGTAVLKDAEGNVYPTYAPEATVAPTIEPSAEPSDAPTAEPSDAPTDEPAATATTAPVTPVTYKYTSTSEIKGGNLCEGDTCTFVDEASEEIRTLFADGSDAAKVAPALTANYKNYVGGTGSKASQPYIEGINLEPGTYNVYYLGYNNEVAIDATIGDISFSIPAASGVAVAREDNNASRVLKAYKFTFTAETALTNATLKFNTTEQWLPDIFSVILTNTTVAANAAGVDGAVQYLIPEGDVVTVDATAETAGQVASVTVTGADGQDVKVENNKFTMPGQNVTADITFAEAPATETPEPTEAPATETPVPSATATPTEAPATETPAPTDAPVSTIAPIPAKGMTLPSGVNTTDKSSKVYNWNDKATDEMKAVFGDPLTGVNTEALVPMGAADRTISAKINVSAEQAGSYKLMVLGIEYSNRYYNVKVDSGNAIAPENTNPGKVALIDPTESNSDLTITTYDLGELTEGEHTISVISAANNSRDFFAMGFVKYTPAPATETPAPTEEPATATPEPSATAEPTEAPATETPAPSATAMPIDDYIKANIDDVNNQLVDGDVQYAQLVPNYDNSTVDVEVLDGTIKNMSVVKSIEAAIGLVNKYDPVAKYAVHYDGSDYATVSAANEAATNFDTVDNRPDGYKSYNPVTVFGKDDSPSAIAIGKAVSASLGLNTEQFNSISTTDLATFLGYLEANSKYSVNVTAYGADGNSIFTYKFIFADKQPVPTATAEPTATPEATATAAPIVVNMFDKSAVAISAGSQDTGLYWDNTKSGNMALIKSSVVGSFEGAQGIILREGTSGAVSVNVYKTKATTATDVDATQIATREIKMTGGYTPNYDNIISFEDGTTFESDDNILIKLSAIDHSSYCGNYSTCTISFDMPRYDIALDTFENGVASINSKSNPTVANAITKAAEGELVFVTATANADYELADVQYKGASESDYTKSASIAGAKTTAVAFEMPGEAATVKPIINALTYVTASISADNGSVTFTDGVASDTNRAITGKNVSFTVSANDGYAVESVKVMAGNDDVSSSVGLVENLGVYSFTTPLTDFTVTVNYIEAKAITVASVSNGSVSVENVTRPELIKKELNTAASVTWKAYDETANAIAANATDPDPITIDGVGVVDLPNNNDSATATDKKWTRGTSYKFNSSIGNFTGSISGGGNPRPSSFSGTPSATNLPAAGTVFEFTAAADGQMQIAYFAGSGKTLYLLESEPNADKGTQLATFTGANANAITDVFEVKAGNTYYFFGGATKAQYFGFKFVPYNYTILGVAGDTIKVNATPESGNYVVDTVTYATATEPSNSIPVVDNGDGYTFEMPNDAVTVNATFVNSII